jgi:hypothetical protein
MQEFSLVSHPISLFIQAPIGYYTYIVLKVVLSRRPGFDPKSSHVGFVVEKFSIFIYHLGLVQ